MAYTAVPKVDPAELWEDSDFNTYIKDNFAVSPAALAQAKGDLFAGTASQAGARVAVGANHTVLVADSGESAGIKWSGGAPQVGMIILWSGAVVSIPSGWVLCDGNNSTPDLRGRFVVGAGSSYAVDATGGAASIDLEHSHTPTETETDSDGAHTHGQGATGAGGNHRHAISGNTGAYSGTSGNYQSGAFSTVTDPNHDHAKASTGYTEYESSHTHTNPDTGSDGSHTHSVGATDDALSATQATLPQYYALAFIMYTG